MGVALEILRDLVAQLRRGRGLSAYDRGTVWLCAEEILAQLPEEPAAKAVA